MFGGGDGYRNGAGANRERLELTTDSRHRGKVTLVMERDVWVWNPIPTLLVTILSQREAKKTYPLNSGREWEFRDIVIFSAV